MSEAKEAIIKIVEDNKQRINGLKHTQKSVHGDCADCDRLLELLETKVLLSHVDVYEWLAGQEAEFELESAMHSLIQTVKSQYVIQNHHALVGNGLNLDVELRRIDGLRVAQNGMFGQDNQRSKLEISEISTVVSKTL